MSKEMLSAFTMLEEEKGINRKVVIAAIEEALELAYKRQYGSSTNVEIQFDDKKGDFVIYQIRTVVEEVFDNQIDISLADARALNPAYELGDQIKFEEKPKDFARTAASAAKQVIVGKMREEERDIIYNNFLQYENEIMTGSIDRIDERSVYVNLGRVTAALGKRDQIPGENYQVDDRLSVFIESVTNTPKGVRVHASRTAPGLVKRLFEQEIPEVYDGTIEIKGIAREAGDRAKVIVNSLNPSVDAIGTVVGPKGARIQKVVNALHGENMDIIAWDPDEKILIKNALKPAQVSEVVLLEGGAAIVVVPDDQLSLAIGKRGQNVRLAAHVTNHKIDIKSETDYDLYLEQEANETPLELSGDALVESIETIDLAD